MRAVESMCLACDSDSIPVVCRDPTNKHHACLLSVRARMLHLVKPLQLTIVGWWPDLDHGIHLEMQASRVGIRGRSAEQDQKSAPFCRCCVRLVVKEKSRYTFEAFSEKALPQLRHTHSKAELRWHHST